MRDLEKLQRFGPTLSAVLPTISARILTRISILTIAVCFIVAGRIRAQDVEPSKTAPIDRQGPIDVLSDTKGFNMKPYLSQVIEGVRNSWYLLIGNDHHFPKKKKGRVAVEFRVEKNGHISDVKYNQTSGNDKLDRVAFSAIAGSDPLQPFPEEFPCQSVTLKFTFLYNPAPGQVPSRNFKVPVLPCVTSKIAFAQALSVTVWPSGIQLAVGRSAQFNERVEGAADSAVTWSVSGQGCEGAACGVISASGLYTAPAKIPDPPTVSVTATTAITSGLSGSSNITIVAAERPR